MLLLLRGLMRNFLLNWVIPLSAARNAFSRVVDPHRINTHRIIVALNSISPTEEESKMGKWKPAITTTIFTVFVTSFYRYRPFVYNVIDSNSAIVVVASQLYPAEHECTKYLNIFRDSLRFKERQSRALSICRVNREMMYVLLTMCHKRCPATAAHIISSWMSQRDIKKVVRSCGVQLKRRVAPHDAV